MILREFPLSNFNLRPERTEIDTIVVHCMYLGGLEGEDRFDAERCIFTLESEKVSAHYTVSRDGVIFRHLDEVKRAWHAGVSQMPGDKRQNVNDFSIGIELIGSPDSDFSDAQYSALIELVRDIRSRHPIQNYLGHSEVAPGRKVDPGPHFNWERFLVGLGVSSRGM